ncbi:MAG: phosphotransferase [Lysobacter sp.]|nr:phosphotransferase [Lysobacter sp.]
MTETNRDALRLAWTRTATNDPSIELVRASVDAGFRSYWRTVGHAASNSVIVMDSPPDKEDVRPWLAMRDVLESGGVRVPLVIARDVDAGFLVLEDLGADTYLHVITSNNADTLFDDAIDQLLKLQSIPVPTTLPAYDEPMLVRELKLFEEWFLGHHLGMVLDYDDLERLALVYRRLTDAALAQPQVLVHRDFMPRNLMPIEGGPAVLDFQDAVRGPIAYDPTCLFKDAFLSWPQDRVDAWLDRYHARAVEAGLPVPDLARFRRDADWIGVQRHLKVIGIFARLNHRDHKSKYLHDVPRFFGYLDAVLPNYPELSPLAELIEHKVKPAMRLRAGVVGE